MTDIDKLANLLDEFGVEYERAEDEIKCEEGGKKISGYTFFYTVFKFDSVGKFIEMGAYE